MLRMPDGEYPIVIRQKGLPWPPESEDDGKEFEIRYPEFQLLAEKETLDEAIGFAQGMKDREFLYRVYIVLELDRPAVGIEGIYNKKVGEAIEEGKNIKL